MRIIRSRRYSLKEWAIQPAITYLLFTLYYGCLNKVSNFSHMTKFDILKMSNFEIMIIKLHQSATEQFFLLPHCPRLTVGLFGRNSFLRIELGKLLLWSTNWYYHCKLVFFGDINNFYQKSKFWLKIEILVKNRNFGQKSNLWSKIEILVKNRNFCQKSKFRAKKISGNYMGYPNFYTLAS